MKLAIWFFENNLLSNTNEKLLKPKQKIIKEKPNGQLMKNL